MATFPYGTGPILESKDTARDAGSNTTKFWNGEDANALKTIADAVKGILAGSYRGHVTRNSTGTVTGVTVHTVMALVDGYRKTLAPTAVLIPQTAGDTYLYVECNATSADMTVATAATEPTTYGTATRAIPLAKLTVTGSDLQVSSIRPDWVIGDW